MNKRTGSIALGGFFAVAATAAAIGAQAQTPSQEVFQLASVAGQPLPVVVEEEDGCRDELLSATLTLEPDGDWELTSTEREVCGGDVETEDEVDQGRYTLDAQTVRFLDDDDDAPVADDDEDDPTEIEVDDLAVGTRSGTMLVVRLADGRTDLEFRQ